MPRTRKTNEQPTAPGSHGAQRRRRGSKEASASALPPLAAAGEPLQPQDLAITLFAGFAAGKHERLWSGGLVDILGELGFSYGAARVALARLVNRGLLERLKEGRLVYYSLSSRTQRILSEGERRVSRLGSAADRWDGRWTMLWHAIPETRRVERSRLGRRLRFLGFGPIQDGTWISPHNRERDAVALVREIGVEKHAGVLIGRSPKQLELQPMVERAWDLERLARRYESFVDTFGRYGSRRAQKALSDHDAFLVRTSALHQFRRFAFLDPELPDDLMVRRVPRREAGAIFQAIHEGLERPAQRHFDLRVGRARGGR